MKSRKIIAAIAAAAMVLAMAGCGGNSNSSTSTESTSGSSSVPDSTISQGGAPEITASILTAGISDDAVVAEFEKYPELNVTFGEFLKEYKYTLYQNGVADDTNPFYASSLQSQREYIVNYLVNEKIAEIKFEEYGLSLSEEDLAQIETETAAGIRNVKNNLGTRIQQSAASSGVTLTEDELAQSIEQEYKNMLEYCGMTEDDFRSWQTSSVMQKKLADYVSRDYVYDRAEYEAQIEQVIEDTKLAYEQDPANYDPQNIGDVWLPEGSREVQQILIAFDDETMAEIQALRSEGKDAEAVALKNEKLEAFTDEIAEVEGKIAAGEDFTELMKQYNDDTNPTATYIVTPGTAKFVESFTECAMGISEVGGTASCTSDYGYHIVKYTAEAVVTDEEYQEYMDNMHAYLEESIISQNLGNATKEWREEIAFTIDRETLLLTVETSETAEAAETAQAKETVDTE